LRDCEIAGGIVNITSMARCNPISTINGNFCPVRARHAAVGWITLRLPDRIETEFCLLRGHCADASGIPEIDCTDIYENSKHADYNSVVVIITRLQLRRKI